MLRLRRNLSHVGAGRFVGNLSTCMLPRFLGPPCGALPGRRPACRPPRLVAVQFFREDRASATPGANDVHPTPPAGRAAEPSSRPADTTIATTSTTTTAASPSSPAFPTAPPPPLAPSPPALPPGFTARRLLVFSGLVLGYAAYYLTRNSLTYAAPLMVADPALPGFSMAQVGTLTSIFPIAYGTSKLLSGIVGDRFSPAALLGGGLLATAACNLAFGAGSGAAWFAALWALNGVMQGVGAPSCARMLTSWFAPAERGTYWGLWNVAHNTGGFVSPLLAATAAHAGGWRWGMWAPGALAAALGGYVLLVCRDAPRAAGFNLDVAQPSPPRGANVSAKDGARAGAPPRPHANANGSGNGAGGADRAGAAATSSGAAGVAAGDEAGQEQPAGLFRTAFNNVLSNPYVWALALTYFCVYVVRQGVTSWSVFYLINEKRVPDVAQAAVRVSGLELGGLLGGLVAGRVSDVLIRRDAQRRRRQDSGDGGAVAGSVGRRVQVVMAYTVALAAALAAFRALPPGAPPLLQWLSVAAIGFCIYGPQMMIGLCGAELVHPASVGASQGVLGWVAYLGAANAGVPLSAIITRFGWSAYFASLTAACALALLLLAPMVRLSSYSQRQQEEREQPQRG